MLGWAVLLGRKIKDWNSSKKLSCENEGAELSSGNGSVVCLGKSGFIWAQKEEKVSRVQGCSCFTVEGSRIEKLKDFSPS